MEGPSQTLERILRPDEFDPPKCERGRKYSIALDLGPQACGVMLPVLLVRGRKEGNTLVVTAGVHGDEFEGVRAILELHAELDPSEMRGDVLAVPVANPPAFWNKTRTSPLDGENLARSFPGSEHGTPTQVIAFYLSRAVIARADFYLDLHSSGLKLLMPSMVGYDARDPRSQSAAARFGAPVTWGHPTISPGRTVSFAASRGIPWLYTEARGAGRIAAEDLRMFKRGIVNLLRHLAILPGIPTPAPVEHELHGDGNVDAGNTAAQPGFFIPSVELLQSVHAGQEIGQTMNLYGGVVEAFRSPCDGVVGMIRAVPVVEPGDSIFLITGLRK